MPTHQNFSNIEPGPVSPAKADLETPAIAWESPADESDRLRVIYIMGCGRSGSTVLDTLLGNRPNTVGVGELHMLSDSLADNAFCSCRQPIRDCEFWVEVMRLWRPEGAREFVQYVAFQKKFESLRWMGSSSWLQLARERWLRRSAEFTTYLAETQRLYEAIAQVSGARVIVESSKLPIRAAVLRQIPGIDLALVHLVRDVRGVVWSCGKSIAAQADAGVATAQSGRSLCRTVAYWSLVNRVASQVCRGAKSMRLRYEDLVVNPDESIRQIERLAGVGEFLPELADGGGTSLAEVPVKIGHLFSGNRLRMAEQLTLRADTEWYERMPQTDQRWAAWLSRRLLREYGYAPCRS